MVRRLIPVTVLAAAMLLGSLGNVAAQENDPGAVLEAWFAAVNAGDTEAQGALFAENATATLPADDMVGEPKTVTGRDAIIEELGTDPEEMTGFRLEHGEITVEGDDANAPYSIRADELDELGLSLDGTVQVTVTDGLIQSLTLTISEESLAAIEAAMSEMIGEAEVIEEPVTEEGVTEEPVAEEPVAEEPVVEEPVVGETEEGMGEGEGGMGPGEDDAAMGENPETLPATGDAGDPLPLALMAGLMLVAGGVALRRMRHVA